MAYNTTGQSHANGLDGESQVDKFFKLMKGRCFGLEQQYGEFIRIDSFGGTQNKDDSRAVYRRAEVGISTKNHGSDGTYDYMNTTIFAEEVFPELARHVKENLRKFKGCPRDKKIKKEYRRDFTEKVQKAINNLDPKTIHQMLKYAMKGTREQLVVVIDQPADTSERFKGFYGEHHPIYECLESGDCELFLKQPRAKLSAQIWVRNHITGKERKTDLRLRVGLNNGYGAWLWGKDWSTNNSSSLCIKIQQDNVDGLFQELNENGHLLTEPEIV